MCLEIGYPTLASVPHSIINGYKKVLAVAVETDYSFPLAEKVQKSNQNEMFGAQTTNHLFLIVTIMILPLSQQVKAYLADPSAFAAVAAPAATETAAAAPAAKEEVKEESEESDDDMGFGLFD